MAFASADRVQETSTTTGTGTYDLAGAVTGFQGFVAGIGNGNTCYYCATMGADWEVGIGTVTDAATDTLARTTILQSSNSDNAVNWGAGTKTIFCTAPALVLGMLVGNGQIKFPATQNSSSDANTLDDYEEGTFTPAFAASGSTFSYSSQVGAYTKVGRLVHFSVRIALNTSGNTLTGNQVTITALPFAVANTANYVPQFNCRWQATTSSFVFISPQAIAAGTSIFFNGTTAAATSLSSINDNQLLHATNGSVIWVSGVYVSD